MLGTDSYLAHKLRQFCPPGSSQVYFIKGISSPGLLLPGTESITGETQRGAVIDPTDEGSSCWCEMERREMALDVGDAHSEDVVQMGKDERRVKAIEQGSNGNCIDLPR